MKIHDFGLWFAVGLYGNKITWDKAIPSKSFTIFYDGVLVGDYNSSLQYLYIIARKPYIIMLEKPFAFHHESYGVSVYKIERQLTLADFRIEHNP